MLIWLILVGIAVVVFAGGWYYYHLYAVDLLTVIENKISSLESSSKEASIIIPIVEQVAEAVVVAKASEEIEKI